MLLPRSPKRAFCSSVSCGAGRRAVRFFKASIACFISGRVLGTILGEGEAASSATAPLVQAAAIITRELILEIRRIDFRMAFADGVNGFTRQAGLGERL